MEEMEETEKVSTLSAVFDRIKMSGPEVLVIIFFIGLGILQLVAVIICFLFIFK